MESLVKSLPVNLQPVASSVLVSSLYLQQQLRRHPAWLNSLINTKSYSPFELIKTIQADLSAVSHEFDLLATIRTIRNREMCRIAWRDLAGIAELTETMRDTSDLADGLISAALDWWHKDLSGKFGTPLDSFGEPQKMVILGMGKLGGQELNFSSDIDLIFAFPESGQTQGGRSMDNQTFFTQLGQKLINSLSKQTADGMAYRVDMRLRPFGDSGALALSFDAMEHYYQTHGRDWERYAMIKARAITGDKHQGHALFSRLKPFIYRRYLDYGSIEQLRLMKAAIDKEARRKGKTDNVKLGEGGIREVEFVVQVFQLIRGGRVRQLQGQPLLKILNVIAELELLSTTQADSLQQAYIFLRKVENRIQMWDDQQAHSLPPAGSQQLLTLAASMQFDDSESFHNQLVFHRNAVKNLFDSTFVRSSASPATENDNTWSLLDSEDDCKEKLSMLGYVAINETYRALHSLKTGRLYHALTELGRQRLDRLMPALVTTCATQPSADLALQRSLNLVNKIASRSGYIAMLADHQAALELLVKLISASSLIATEIERSPILLDELLDTRQLYLPLDKFSLKEALATHMEQVATDDQEQVMERLRHFKKSQILRVSATDIMGKMPLMKVSDQLTWIAEAILDYTLKNAWQTLVEKHGEPEYIDASGHKRKAGFAIIGYGKLGGLELGYGSDLDIIFLHDSSGSQQQTNGGKPVENGVFYTRLAQRIIHMMNTQTMSGRLYETDTRLRPSGASGLMVSNIDAFQKYQREKAWTWEHQALVRARSIAGTEDVMLHFEQIRQQVLALPRDMATLRRDVLDMRAKMWEHLGTKTADLFDLKKDPGGITDIEFMVQFLVLAHASKHDLTEFADNIRILEALVREQIITAEVGGFLTNTYKAMRDQIHALALQEQKSFIAPGLFATRADRVKEIWNQLFELEAK